jgi:hypothetical protein
VLCLVLVPLVPRVVFYSVACEAMSAGAALPGESVSHPGPCLLQANSMQHHPETS